MKEKIEKPELKDQWEPKNWIEPKEIMEPKDILEPKHRLEPKEIREPKDFGEPKGYEPKDYEPKGFDGDPRDPIGRSELNARLGKLESDVSQLTHFINSQLRPNLRGGALRNEPDLHTQGTSYQKLHKDYADAKQSKDTKDTEKPRER